MTKLTTKSAICNRTERFSRMRRQDAPMLSQEDLAHKMAAQSARYGGP
jgi:hypothetical protein